MNGWTDRNAVVILFQDNKIKKNCKAHTVHSMNFIQYNGKRYLLIISHCSSIKFPSPMIIGPASAMMRALGCTTVLLPKQMQSS